jgi:hypothetical protein
VYGLARSLSIQRYPLSLNAPASPPHHHASPCFTRNQVRRYKNTACAIEQAMPTIKEVDGDFIYLGRFTDIEELIWNVTPQTYPRSLETQNEPRCISDISC